MWIYVDEFYFRGAMKYFCYYLSPLITVGKKYLKDIGDVPLHLISQFCCSLLFLNNRLEQITVGTTIIAIACYKTIYSSRKIKIPGWKIKSLVEEFKIIQNQSNDFCILLS